MLKIRGEVLASAVTWVSQSLDMRGLIPSYGMVRWKVKKDDLTVLHMSGVNKDSSAQVAVSLEEPADDSYDFLIPGGVLTSFAKNVTPASVATFELAPGLNDSGGKFVAKSNKLRITTTVLPSTSAATPLKEPSLKGHMDSADFVRAIKKVVHAAAGDKGSIPIFTGVQLIFNEEERTATFTATDRFQLSTVTVPYSPEKMRDGGESSTENSTESSSATKSFVVPAKVLEQYARFFNTSSSISLGFYDGSSDDVGAGVFLITDGTRTAVTRLLDGDYPNWKPIFDSVSAGSDVDVVFKTHEVLMSVKRLLSMAKTTSPLLFTFTEGELLLKVETEDKTVIEDSVPVEYEGDPFSVKYTGEYVVAALNSCGDMGQYSTAPARDDGGRVDSAKLLRKAAKFETVNDDSDLAVSVYILMPLA